MKLQDECPRENALKFSLYYELFEISAADIEYVVVDDESENSPFLQILKCLHGKNVDDFMSISVVFNKLVEKKTQSWSDYS